MNKSMMPLAILPLFASPLLFGGDDAGHSIEETRRTAGLSSAVVAADGVLYSVQNWSAPGLGGASWIDAPARDSTLEHMLLRDLGGARPRVRVDGIQVEFLHTEKGRKQPGYRVVLDLHVQAVDRIEVAAAMLESFRETMDEHNGDFDASIGDTIIDPATMTIHAPRLMVELPAIITDRPPPPSRPLTEILRRVGADEQILGRLRIKPDERHLTGKRVQRYLDLELDGGHAEWAVANCGSLLHRLEEGDGALVITRLSLRKSKGQDEGVDGWKLRASLMVARADG